MSQIEKFKYSISKNGGILAASFSGVMDFDSISGIQNATQEMFSDPNIRFIAIDFSQVGNITMDAIPAFIQLQRIARDRQQQLRLCGLNSELKEKLLSLGVVRFKELSSNLKEAILSATRAANSVEATKKAC